MIEAARRGWPASVAWAGGSFAFYLLLAGSLAPSELVTAAALGFVFAGWPWLLRGCAPDRLAAGRDHLAPWGRSLAGLLPKTVRTGAALLGVIAGRAVPAARTSRFVAGVRDDPAARGRRATAVLAASLAPDSFVVRVDPHGNRVAVHPIATSVTKPDERWLA